MLPKASVVALNWNGGKSIKLCIDSILKQTYKNLEIILVDNASTDGSYEFALKNKRIKVVRNSENLGAAGGYNTGYANSTGKYVILISHDSILDKNCVKELVKGMEDDKTLGCAEGVCRHHDGKVYNSNLNVLFFNTPQNENVKKKAYPGLPVIIKKSCLDSYTDSDYFFYGEDVYCGLMVNIKGYKCKRIMKAEVLHEGSPTVKRKPKFYRYLDERNRWVNYFIFYEKRTIMRYFGHNIIFSLGRLLNGLRTGYFSSFVRAYFWILSHPHIICKKRRYVQRQRKVKDAEMVKELSRKIF